MPVFSRPVRRGIFAVAALAAIAGGGMILTGAAPFGSEMASGLFHTASTARAGETQLAQAESGKASRSGTVEGESSTRTTKSFGGWTVVCNESGEPVQRICSANFRVINQQNKANVLVWLIGFNAEGELLSEFMTLTDVQIQPGVAVTLENGEALSANFVECTTRGCKARLVMNDTILSQLKASSNATIAITRLDGQVIQFQMQIPGVDQALAELGV